MRASGGGAEFEVRDTGIGIAPEFLAHAFDRFRQADSSVSRTHGGLGLGLAIVRQLVDLHGGAVTIESDGVGEGCAVTVRLPLRAEAAEPLARRRSSPDGRDDRPSVDGALADARVLVVDDDPDGRALVALLLELNGAEVTAVASGVEALAAVPTARPDVLVSDLGMPGLDGFELLRQVRRLPAGDGGATPAVAVTAYARAEDRARAMEAGFAGYVSKPVEPAALVAAVAALLPGG
jgi:CheY-like chemotaxis protein